MIGTSESLQNKIEQTINEMLSRDVDTLDVIGASIFFVSTNPNQKEGIIPLSETEKAEKTFYVFQKGH